MPQETYINMMADAFAMRWFIDENYILNWSTTKKDVEGRGKTKMLKTKTNSLIILGSGCGAVGRAVAYDTRGPGFESSHRQLLFEHLFTVNCL